MEYFITALLLALFMAPFAWPAVATIYRYFRDLEDQRHARAHPPVEQ